MDIGRLLKCKSEVEDLATFLLSEGAEGVRGVQGQNLDHILVRCQTTSFNFHHHLSAVNPAVIAF